MNSIRNVKRAIEFESDRLIECLERGESVTQQTRSFDAGNGTTFPIRDKEDADDYRYFPEPDLTPFNLQDDFIETIRRTIPVLQEERIKKYVSELQLSEYDANVITEEKEFADYFENIVRYTNKYKAASNWMIGPVRSWLNENNHDINSFPIPGENIASLIELVEAGKVNFALASAKIFPYLIKDPLKKPETIAEELDVLQESDESFIEPLIDEVLNKFADKVKEYQKGKKGLLALFVGEVMKRSKGKADPSVINKLLLIKLKS